LFFYLLNPATTIIYKVYVVLRNNTLIYAGYFRTIEDIVAK